MSVNVPMSMIVLLITSCSCSESSIAPPRSDSKPKSSISGSHVEHNAHAFRTFTLGSTISIALCEVEGPPGKTSYSKSSRQRKDMLSSWFFGHLKTVTQKD